MDQETEFKRLAQRPCRVMGSRNINRLTLPWDWKLSSLIKRSRELMKFSPASITTQEISASRSDFRGLIYTI